MFLLNHDFFYAKNNHNINNLIRPIQVSLEYHLFTVTYIMCNSLLQHFKLFSLTFYLKISVYAYLSILVIFILLMIIFRYLLILKQNIKYNIIYNITNIMQYAISQSDSL